jgi:hypothetical protein
MDVGVDIIMNNISICGGGMYKMLGWKHNHCQC